MNTNPFAAQNQYARREIRSGAGTGEFQPAPRSDSAAPEQPPGPGQIKYNMFKIAIYLCALFLFAVFCVFREVRHSRELFRMNQLVLAADVQRQHWQELERLDEAREATLLAELQRLQSQAASNASQRAAYHIPARSH